MRFMDRLRLVVKADAHGVMDQLEEKSLLVKQHLREAELEVERKHACLEALDEEARELAEAARVCEGELASLDDDVELALGRGEEELARFALRRLLPRRRALGELRERAARLHERRGRLQQKLDAQAEQLEVLRARSRARLSELHDAESRDRVSEAPVEEAEVEIELLRRRSASEAGAAQEGRA